MFNELRVIKVTCKIWKRQEKAWIFLGSVQSFNIWFGKGVYMAWKRSHFQCLCAFLKKKTAELCEWVVCVVDSLIFALYLPYIDLTRAERALSRNSTIHQIFID